MNLLVSNQLFDELAKFYPESGEYKIVTRQSMSNTDIKSMSGFYDILSGTFIALYKDKNRLYIYAKNKVLPLGPTISTELSGTEEVRQLVISESGHEIMRLNYVLDLSLQLSDDPTPFIESEDFDFGLFISNVLQSDERQKVLLECWANNNPK